MKHFRAKIFSLLFQLITLVIFPFAAAAQPDVEMKKIFAEAESCNLFEEYELAVPLYLILERPDNFNILYKIGVCYLNIPGEKDKAIPYLEKAVKNASFDAKITSYKEKRAPLDSYFFLAKSYMINNQLDRALETLESFKKLAVETEKKGGMKNLAYIDQEIQACKNAMNSQETPYALSKKPLGKIFSQGSINENPAVSFDGSTIVYTERRGMNNAILFSKKIRGKWQPPIEINSQLRSGKDCSSSSLNNDGTQLFLYKTDNFDGNIYFSEFINKAWTPIKKLNNNINTKYYESHAAISADNKKLFFTSNREDSKGGLDIYVSERDALGDWGPATNLGETVNTIYNEDNPFITLNDSLLYFSSEGHSGMGGYDIFRTWKSGAGWKTPDNLGFPLNSTDDDKFFQPFNNDENGFYSIFTDYKKKEIFYITLTNPRLNRIFEIKGDYSLKDTIVVFDEGNSIYLTDKTSGDTLDIGYPDSRTGKYNFITGPGKFSLVYTGPGYYTQTADTTILIDNPSKVIEMEDIILDTYPPLTIPVVYEKIDLTDIPRVAAVDPSILIRDVQVLDVSDSDASDTTVLYYTVQVMALYNPVDVSYFKYVNDIKVLFNERDLFYRYTTGHFDNKNDAYAHKAELLNKGYPDDLFVKKVTRMSKDKVARNQKYFTIQLKVLSKPGNIETLFPGLKGVSEVEEMDGFYHYHYGRYTSPAEAESALGRVKQKGFGDAFVKEIVVLAKK